MHNIPDKRKRTCKKSKEKYKKEKKKPIIS